MKLSHRVVALWTATLVFASVAATAEAPRRTERARCQTEERLFGDWSSYQPGSSGPTWHRVRFTCDCQYIALRQSQDVHERERGTFAVSRGWLQMHSHPQAQPAPSERFHFERGELYWPSDGASTPHRYRRTAVLQCTPTSQPPSLRAP